MLSEICVGSSLSPIRMFFFSRMAFKTFNSTDYNEINRAELVFIFYRL